MSRYWAYHAVSLVLLAGFILQTSTNSSAPPPVVATYKVVAWNDLGMHCMDSDYSVFSILPPYNNLHAQVITSSGQLVENQGTLTVVYEAVADPTGSINTTSVGKTNFWQWAPVIYGSGSVPNVGLAGHNMPGAGNVPQTMTFDPGRDEFVAEGVPITPYADSGRKRTYPMMKVKVLNSSGTVLASTVTVQPVSDEMDCRMCHASDSGPAAMPTAGWVHDANAERDYRLNILRLHDEQQLSNPTYTAALAAKNLNPAGLYASVVVDQKPMLCAGCHASNALPGTGITGISPLTRAMHAGHAAVADPETGMPLESSQNRASCYRCHPGSETRCLRGAMGSAVAPDGSLSMQCQSCHGTMNSVGAVNRQGWFEQPSCQQCHTGTATQNNGQIRYTSAFESNGTPRVAVDSTFATNANTPLPGLDLFRFSSGHGGLQCEACHGSTHAEYPALHQNDNVQSANLQGHAGVLIECTACHSSEPETETGGPHGMHPVGNNWVVDDHGDAAEHNGIATCQVCHGADSKGTVLSVAHSPRSFSTQFGSKSYFKGERVSCYGCHGGPSNENTTTNTKPSVTNATMATVNTPVSVLLTATDVNTTQTLTLRIVDQPQHGSVALAGFTVTYYPEPGFAGNDSFTFAAWDGFSESNLGVVTVMRGASFSSYGTGYPGTGGVVPSLTVNTAPQLGATITLSIGNSSGVPAFAALLVDLEPANLPTQFGGTLAVAPFLPYVPMVLPAGGDTLSATIANDPGLIGMNIYCQTVQFDPGALFNFAFSRGLRLSIGQ